MTKQKTIKFRNFTRNHVNIFGKTGNDPLLVIKSNKLNLFTHAVDDDQPMQFELQNEKDQIIQIPLRHVENPHCIHDQYGTPVDMNMLERELRESSEVGIVSKPVADTMMAKLNTRCNNFINVFVTVDFSPGATTKRNDIIGSMGFRSLGIGPVIGSTKNPK
jgi:hypothetical protein